MWGGGGQDRGVWFALQQQIVTHTNVSHSSSSSSKPFLPKSNQGRQCNQLILPRSKHILVRLPKLCTALKVTLEGGEAGHLIGFKNT